jgi:hypothetical protein
MAESNGGRHLCGDCNASGIFTINIKENLIK